MDSDSARPKVKPDDSRLFKQKLELHKKLGQLESLVLKLGMPATRLFYFTSACKLSKIQPGIINGKITDDFLEDIDQINMNQNISSALLFSSIASGVFVISRKLAVKRPLLRALAFSFFGTFIGSIVMTSQNMNMLLNKYPVEEIVNGPLILIIKSEREQFYKAHGIEKVESPPTPPS